MEVLPVSGIATVLAAILTTSGLVVLAWLTVSKVGMRVGPQISMLRLPSMSPAAAARPAQTVMPDRLSRDAQWERATGFVTQSIARVETVHELQRAAEQQLDAATYAIQRLLAELSGVVTIPAEAASAEPAPQQPASAFALVQPRREAVEAIAA